MISLPVAEPCNDDVITAIAVPSEVHIEVLPLPSDIERGPVTEVYAIDDYESRQQTCVRALIACIIFGSAITGIVYGIITQ